MDHSGELILQGRKNCENPYLFPSKVEATRMAMKRYMCLICGFIYDEAQGWPGDGIAPGTRWKDVPPNWVCPDCGARKDDFEMVEI
jgi:rubredoxin